VAFIAFVHLALFLALSLSPGNSLEDERWGGEGGKKGGGEKEERKGSVKKPR